MDANDDPRVLRSLLRADLIAATKARELDTVTALRTVLPVFDNAEAVDITARPDETVSGPIAGASAGASSTEMPRRVLSVEDLRAILAAHIAEHLTAADDYER